MFKAIGAPTRSILAGLALQAVVVALLAAAVGVVLDAAVAPLFPMTVASRRGLLVLPVIAIAIGLLASSPGCGARWRSIPRSRSEVLEPWAI